MNENKKKSHKNRMKKESHKQKKNKKHYKNKPMQHRAIAMWCATVLSPCLTEYSNPAQLSSSRAIKPQRARHAAIE